MSDGVNRLVGRAEIGTVFYMFMAGLPDALPFTSLLNIDLDRELEGSFNKKRVHVSLCRRSSIDCRRVDLARSC